MHGEVKGGRVGHGQVRKILNILFCTLNQNITEIAIRPSAVFKLQEFQFLDTDKCVIKIP